MMVDNITCARGFSNFGVFAYFCLINCYNEHGEMNSYSKSNSQELIKYIKR